MALYICRLVGLGCVTLGVMVKRAYSQEWVRYMRGIGDNLYRIRTSKGLGQERVANDAGLSRYTLQRLERPSQNPSTSSNPTLLTLISLCNVLDVELSDILPPGPLPDPGPPGGEFRHLLPL